MEIGTKLLKILVDNGELTQKQADEIKLASLNENLPILSQIERRNYVSEEKLLDALSQVYNVPFIILTNKSISPEILNFIPEPVARRYKVIPIEVDEKKDKLMVAMADPMDLALLEFLEQKSGKKIIPLLAKETDVLFKVDEAYSQGLSLEVTEALKETESPVRTIQADKLSEIIKEAPIAKIVSTTLEFAIKSRASDVHIEPEEKRSRVRYRIDGILQEKLALPRSVHEAVVSRIKILSNMKIDERRLPQDGRFNFKLQDEEVDLRVSTLPTVHGEKVVMRLLWKTGGIPSLSELGYSGTALKNLEYAITRPHGIILITGPTGSGKTTTLYSILSRLNTNKVNIITLEDPVEYEIPGINQVQVNPQAGLTFASGMRAFLRQDPNIILVGEIRDMETTSLAVQAALTGHLVFSTLHTNNASTAIPRLLDLGAEPFLITSVLHAVGAQRIVRKLCQSCRESYVPPKEALVDVKKVLSDLLPMEFRTEGKEIVFYRGLGCKECNNSGFLGRIGVYETLSVSPAISKLILQRAGADIIEKQAISEGLVTLKQDGYLKAIAGITSIEEILRVAQE